MLLPKAEKANNYNLQQYSCMNHSSDCKAHGLIYPERTQGQNVKEVRHTNSAWG